jgi:thymidylate kinase
MKDSLVTGMPEAHMDRVSLRMEDQDYRLECRPFSPCTEFFFQIIGGIKMLTITKTLFDGMNREQVRYCIIRDTAYLRQGLEGDGEVDVLVHPEEIRSVQRLLTGCGFKRFLEPGGVQDSHMENWIGFDEKTGKLMPIHLYQDIVLEGKNGEKSVFLWRDIALNRRIPFEGTTIYVVEPHLEMVMLYIQLAQRVEMGEDDPLSWRALCGTTCLCGKIRKEKMAALCSELFWGNGLLISDLLMGMVNREKSLTLKPPTPKELQSLWGKVERELKPTFYKVGSAEDRRRGTLGSIGKGRKIPAKEGISICFIGADGSGKTTISEDIEKWLSQRIACRKFYLGNGDQYHSLSKSMVRRLSGVYRKSQQLGKVRETAVATLAVTDGRILGKREQHREMGLKELVRYPVSVTRAYGHMRFAYHSLKTVEMAETYRKKGGVAIFDRYPQVQFEGIYDGPKISAKFKGYLDRDVFRVMARRESDILKKATGHQPSLVFRLLVPPEVSLQRKPDHDYEVIRRKAEITEKLVFEQSRDYVIDATQVYDKELLEVKRIIWESLRSLS